MTSLNSSMNSNNENPTICFCSLKAIEKNCGECSYMLSKEVKQINAYLYQNQMQLLINLQQQQQNYINEEEKIKTEENYDDKYNNLCEVENKKQYRKSVEICFCQCPAREIQCYGCSYLIPIENDFSSEDVYDDFDNNNNDNDRENEQDNFNDFINEYTHEQSKNQAESFVL
ncbi:hypothetical protein ACTFIR_012333 [Dictyostelium discoideum]